MSRIGEFSVKRDGSRRSFQPPLIPHSWGMIERRGASPLCTPLRSTRHVILAEAGIQGVESREPQTPVRLRRTAPAQHSLIQPPWSPTPPEASASGGLGDDRERRGASPLCTPRWGPRPEYPFNPSFPKEGFQGVADADSRGRRIAFAPMHAPTENCARHFSSKKRGAGDSLLPGV